LSYLHDGTLHSLRQKWIRKVSKCGDGQMSAATANSYQPTVYGIRELSQAIDSKQGDQI
jgi:hypothetical protein